MNKWLYRAVGTVGVASGILMLGGAAYAQDTTAAAPQTDPQALRGLLSDVFSPTSGLNDLGVSLDLPGAGVDAGTSAAGPLQLRANDGRTGVTAYLPKHQAVALGGKLPSLTDAVPSVGRPEFLPALDGLTGGLTGGSGLGGMLGGLTGSGSPLSLVGGVTGNLTGGSGAATSETDDATGGLLGGLTGGDLLGGGTDKGGLLGGLTGGDKGGLLGGLTGKLGGDAAAAPATAATAPQFSQAGLTNGSPNVQTTSGLQTNLDPQTAKQVSQAAQDLVPSMIAQALAKASTGSMPAAADPSQFGPSQFDPSQFDPSQQAPSQFDPSQIDPAQLGLTADDLAGLSADDLAGLSDDDLGLSDDTTAADQSQFFADNPNVAVNWVGPAGGTTATPVQDPAQFGMPVSTESATTEALPIVDQLPLVGPIVGDSGLGKLIVVGNIAQKLPVVGSVLNNQGLPDLDTLPVVNQVLNRGLISNGQGTGGLPVVGNLPVVGDLLGGGEDGLLGSLTGGSSPLGALGGLTGGSSPLGALGGLTGGSSPLGALGGLTGGLTGGSSPLGALGGLTGGLTGGSSPLGGLTGGLTSPLGGLTGGAIAQPTILPAPAMSAAVPARVAPHATARTAAHHTETDRPIAGEDTDYPSTRPEAAGAEGGLPLLGSMGALPVSRTIAQLPLVGDLPVVDSLPVPLALLRGLPVVGTVAGLLPIE